VHCDIILPSKNSAFTCNATASAKGSSCDALMQGTGEWNSGTYPPQSIWFDLVWPVLVTNLALTIDVEPSPTNVAMNVSIFTDTGVVSQVIQFSNSSVSKGQQIPFLFFAQTPIRYLKIDVTTDVSWVAFSAIELQGIPVQQIIPTTSSQIVCAASATAYGSCQNLIHGTGGWNAGFNDAKLIFKFPDSIALYSVSLTFQVTPSPSYENIGAQVNGNLVWSRNNITIYTGDNITLSFPQLTTGYALELDFSFTVGLPSSWIDLTFVSVLGIDQSK